MSYPIRKCFKSICAAWNPKTTILSTFATFFLLSYSKFLFVSIGLLLAVVSYNSKGETVSNSAVLLYDPTIRYFHSEHIPYAVLALSVLLIFVLLPCLFLLLYPTQLFRKFLSLLGFRKWGILNHVMDIFQGWYKDGTGGTRDYRSLSALYLLLRIGYGCEFLVTTAMDYKEHMSVWECRPAPGVVNVLLGVLFYTVQPYKNVWMNHMDGLIFTLTGVLLLMSTFDNKVVYVLAAGLGFSVMIFTGIYHAMYRCTKDCKDR